MSGQLYGNVEPPRAARTLGLSMASVVVCIAGAVATFVMMMVLRIPIWLAGGALLLAAAGVVFLETGKRDGRGRLERVIASRGEKRAHRRDGRGRLERVIASRGEKRAHRRDTSVLVDGKFVDPLAFMQARGVDYCALATPITAQSKTACQK